MLLSESTFAQALPVSYTGTMLTSASTYSALVHLLLGILTLGLCLSVVHSGDIDCTPTDDFEDVIVDLHNFYRAHVYPTAADMRKMYWSARLAKIACERATKCIYDPDGMMYYYPYKGSYAMANLGVYNGNDANRIIYNWFMPGRNHDYVHGCPRQQSSDFTCEHYVQMVWASACEVGCALVECHSLSNLYFYHNPIDPFNDDEVDTTIYLMVCVYGPGFPGDIYNQPPYTIGHPCEQCPEQYSQCDEIIYHSAPQFPVLGVDLSQFQDFVIGAGISEDAMRGLCYNEEEVCIGSDPHFAVRLHGGSLLCYTFQGVQNATFNLVSNDQLVMNALFIPDRTAYDNTWLGSIGIIVLHEGKKMTTLKFTAADQVVEIAGKIEVNAKTIKQLTFRGGKMYITEPSSSNGSYARVYVKFVDSGIEFTVRFTKNGHLDLHWHNTGVRSDKSSGIVGQFFRDGVNIDVDAQLLHVPGRPPVPVKEQDLWKFMEQSFHSDSKCWTSAYHSSQGAGVVAGTYKDYVVDHLLSVGY